MLVSMLNLDIQAESYPAYLEVKHDTVYGPISKKLQKDTLLISFVSVSKDDKRSNKEMLDTVNQCWCRQL